MHASLYRYLAAAVLLPALTAQDNVTIHATSRLVEVNAIVQEKSGEPVRGLTREDFALTDNGRPQTIAVFSTEIAESFEGERTVAAHPLKVGNRTLHQYGKPIPLTVVLFDTLNVESNDDLMYGRQELMKFLRTIRAGDPIALYTLNGPRITAIHDFTDDSSALLAAVQRLAGVRAGGASSPLPAATGMASASAPSAAALEGLSHFLKEASRADEANLLRMRTEWTLSALEGVAHHLSGVPGRKNLIWISSSFPISIGFNATAGEAGVNQELFSYTDRAIQLARLFTDAGVAIYPIDPRGLRTDLRYHADQLATDAIRTPTFETAGLQDEPYFRSMDLLAKQTGGRAFHNTNDLAGRIREAVDDARVTYTLGFYPAEAEWDGKYHALKVTVRRRDVQVRARLGYLALSPAVTSVVERERLLRLAAASPLEGAAIGIEVNVQTNPLAWYGQEMVLRMDAHDIRFEEKGGRMTAAVDAVFVQQEADGSTLRGEKKTLEYALSPDSYQTALAQGLFLEEWISVDPRAWRVRVVVLDASTGATGSVSVPVAAGSGKKKTVF